MANGFFGGGTGVLNDPYMIEDAYDLYAIRFNLTKYYKLANNINMDVPPFDKLGWVPIPGTFAGTLDGDCKKISNLKITMPDTDYVGLFSKVSLDFYGSLGQNYTGRICNISIENAKIAGRNYVGILAGYVYARKQNDVHITDSSALVLEKIHVSGTVSGQQYFGGMIGQLYVYGNNAYNWRLMEDCLIDVQLIVPTDQSNAGLMFGNINGVSANIPRFKDCIARGSYQYSGGNAPNLWSAYPPTNVSVVNPTLETSIYDSTIWNGKQTTGHVAKTSDKMVLKEEFPELELKKISTGGSTWVFGFERFPRLWFLELNNLFIKTDGKYYIYDADSKQWVKKYDRVPTYQEALQYGMKSLSNIDRKAWNMLQSLGHTNIEIINIVDKSVGLTFKDNNVSFDRDTAQDYSNKQVWRKEIDLDDFDHGIFMADKAVNE